MCLVVFCGENYPKTCIKLIKMLIFFSLPEEFFFINPQMKKKIKEKRKQQRIKMMQMRKMNMRRRMMKPSQTEKEKGKK